MGLERKAKMISARLPAELVERLDYITRNLDSESVANRSVAVQTALESWLPSQEEQLRVLGVLPKKARP